MLISPPSKFVDSLRQTGLLSADQLAHVAGITRRGKVDARTLAKSMVKHGWLTVYQVNELLEERDSRLAVGPYHVVDKLGEGGLSTVYKAKHRDTKHLVAIKMIKPEVFASCEGRKQFLHEVEAMARLDHLNIVQFCDADEWNNTYYFAMEYVEGTDLGKIVRLIGALPVSRACDYIRQAAMGLQHAYERNLVHRDIKPVNLFLTHDVEPAAANVDAAAGLTMPMTPLIKIIDWGLASFRNPSGIAIDQSESVSKSIIGTADYLSPEQALNAHLVDIRGDIYSLGCTMYFLLTGQTPFPDGTLMQKLIAHQQAEPTPIEQFRNDVPAEVAAIVKRMTAKKPEDRFQTPASIAVALLAFTRPSVAARESLPGVRPTAMTRTRDDTPVPRVVAKIPKREGKDDTKSPH